MTVDITELFEAGAHFGHKTSRWHPKMAPYIHSVKGDQHIINLDKTVESLSSALAMLEDTASRGKQVLFVGTKRQASKSVVEAATESGQPYVSVRWMGGMLTNNKTINNRIKHLKKLEERMASGDLKARYNKLEVQRFQEEIDDLNHNFGGIKNMNGLPGAVIVTDLLNESIAVKEAQRLGIPIV
ncbi:MAG: 30S ribosomal protein S2, partial [Candidatus Saccharimonadales bacterium]|nr:30S ribosomal protein S2 [Candidatus Saccharimonadales bacterium]